MDENWEHYCNLLSEDKVWGDHYTLVALANITSSVINIYSSKGTFTSIPSQRPEKIIQLGHMFELHYCSILPGNSWCHFYSLVNEIPISNTKNTWHLPKPPPNALFFKIGGKIVPYSRQLIHKKYGTEKFNFKV